MPGKIFLYAPTPVTSASVIAALGYTPADVAGSTGSLSVVGTTQTGSSANSFFSITGTWNTTGTPTADFLNVTDTASNAASLLMDRQVGGVSKFKVAKDGSVTTASNGSLSAPSFVFGGRGANYGFYSPGNSSVGVVFNGAESHRLWNDGTLQLNGASANLYIPSTGWINWNGDTYLYRDAANTLAQRNTTTAQEFRVYGTTTGSKYASMKHDGTNAFFVPTAGQTAFASAALATSATAGFLTIPSCAGTPTGVPASIPTGQVPIVYDSTNNKIAVYNGGWKQTAALA